MTGAPLDHALLLRDFANTLDVDEGTDALADPAALMVWLRSRGLISDGASIADGQWAQGAHGTDPSAQGARRAGAHDAHRTPDADAADLELAIALRTWLRETMRAHHQRPAGGTGATAPAERGSGAPGPERGLEAAAARLPLRVAEIQGDPALVPVEGGVRGGLAWLAAAVVASIADRSWDRLKICAEDSCQWAFLDSSKNRSKHWCSMRACGNRSKTRAYRARRAHGRSGT